MYTLDNSGSARRPFLSGHATPSRLYSEHEVAMVTTAVKKDPALRATAPRTPPTARSWSRPLSAPPATYADCLAWGEDVRAEIIRGEVFIMPSPSLEHQRISGELFGHVYVALKEHPVGTLFAAPVDVRLFPREDLSDTTVVVPDIVVVRDAAKLDGRAVNGAPDLVIEVLSPSSARRDRVLKLQLYQEAGVGEYWIVSPEERTVTVYILDSAGSARRPFLSGHATPSRLYSEHEVAMVTTAVKKDPALRATAPRTPPTARSWSRPLSAPPATYADCLAWGEDVRAEIIRGEVFIMPSPSLEHQRISFELCGQFYDFLKRESAWQPASGMVFAAPVDVRLFPREDLSDTTVVVPDIVVVRDAAKLDGRSVNGPPDLVIEVLSPSTAQRDKGVKRQLYAEAGVQEYWLVSPEDKTVTVYTPRDGGERVYGPSDTIAVAALPGCEVRLEPVFAG